MLEKALRDSQVGAEVKEEQRHGQKRERERLKTTA
jgi:hypothetical protein